jgi:hypothetical protein
MRSPAWRAWETELGAEGSAAGAGWTPASDGDGRPDGSGLRMGSSASGVVVDGTAAQLADVDRRGVVVAHRDQHLLAWRDTQRRHHAPLVIQRTPENKGTRGDHEPGPIAGEAAPYGGAQEAP